MNKKNMFKKTALSSLIGLIVISQIVPAYAALADLSDVPLANTGASAVKPNLMFIIDDSGSMAWQFSPDYVTEDFTGSKPAIEKENCFYSLNNPNENTSNSYTRCFPGDPTYTAPDFNYQYYNPAFTYSPAENYDNTQKTNMNAGNTSNWTSVPTDPFNVQNENFTFGSATTANLKKFPDRVFCKAASDSPTGVNCKKNTTNYQYPDNTYKYGRDGSGKIKYVEGDPYYYKMVPTEYCKEAELKNCTASTVPTGAYTFPALYRWCTSDNRTTCQKRQVSNYQYLKLNRNAFVRVDIISSKAPFPKASTRTDCAGATCTYDEEMTNFANWYSYYRTRMQTMKTAASRVFSDLGDNYRIGLMSINITSGAPNQGYVEVADYIGGAGNHKEKWFNRLFITNPTKSTPLRAALSRAGQYFAGLKPDGMDHDPMQYSCQQNITLLTTDGYWNGANGVKLGGTEISNEDNTNSGYSTRAAGVYDGGLASSTKTLSDTAVYYYKTDLRNDSSIGSLGIPVGEDNVPGKGKDNAKHQHMTTYTLGLGLAGVMNYQSDYESANTGDYRKIINGETGCAWQSNSAVCNWPVPVENTATTVDDLWHAAVSGRGKFFSARNPQDLIDGIRETLADLQTRTGAAAAAATSSPNVTQTDNYIYSTTYRTVKWDGEVQAQRIDSQTGQIIPTIEWSADSLLASRISGSSDTRNIFTINNSGSAKPFKFASLSPAEQAWFSNQICGTNVLSQCLTLSATDKTTANDGNNLVNYLRGQNGLEGDIYRDREYVLGDAVNATPAYVQKPKYNFADAATPTYTEFKENNATRTPVLYVAANDGMLHAFHGQTGQELWAYVPRMVMPEMYRLADTNYATGHRFYVDGTPETMDIYAGGAWKTILVGGLNKGGRGFYAIDVTDPASPKPLWEICHTATLCSNVDADMGYSFGNPLITKRKSDGKWVVIVNSGFNNVSPGNGKGYLYVLDALSGNILSKTVVNEGNTITPLNLSKMNGWIDNFMSDNTILDVYSGDLQGNIWKFDMRTNSPSVKKIAQTLSASGDIQSISTKPELALIKGKRVVYVATGRYLGATDVNDTTIQTIYAFVDDDSNRGNLRNLANIKQNTFYNVGNDIRKINFNDVNWETDDGWYADFLTPGERVNVDPILVLGNLNIATNIPGGNVCTAGGTSWFYQLDYKTGGNINTATDDRVGKRNTTGIIVGMLVVRLGTGALRNIITDASGNKASEEVFVSSGSSAARRTSWRELKKKD